MWLVCIRYLLKVWKSCSSLSRCIVVDLLIVLLLFVCLGESKVKGARTLASLFFTYLVLKSAFCDYWATKIQQPLQ